MLAGGLDTFDWFKDRNKRRKVVVDLSGVAGTERREDDRRWRHRDRRGDDAHRRGATIRLVKEKFRCWRRRPRSWPRRRFGIRARLAATSRRTRVAGTTAPGWTCYRAGGNICYADTPTAINREHAIFDANRCVAVNPSDTAPALIALDAKMVIRSSDGERVVDAENYFIGPSTDITRMTVLQPGELLTAIRIPATWAGAEFYFEKIRERQVWDFPLVNIAAALKVSNGTIQGSRIVVNAVAAHPMRLKAGGRRRGGQTAQRRDGQDGG